MREKLTLDDVTWILKDIYMSENDENTDGNTPEEEIETIHLYIYREEPKQKNIVDADNAKDKTHPFNFALALFFATLLPILSIAFQIFVILNPLVATITLLPVQKGLSMTTDVLAVPKNPGPNQILSYVLRPVTFSQTKIAPATGHGHQNAAFAWGKITFYNGSSTSQTIPQNTQLTGNDGVNIVTDNSVFIPPATSSTPPTFGTASVNAHAIFTGPMGNIQVGDINSYSLGPSILAQNAQPFRGGMDERSFSIVTKSDINNALNPLKTEVSGRILSLLHLQVKEGESLIPPNCKTNINMDQNAGDEASSVKVTYVKTCTGIKYLDAMLYKKGSDLLSALATKQLGANFFPILGLHFQILNSAMKGGNQNAGVIIINVHGVWFYQ